MNDMPNTIFGACPWCEKHNRILFFTVGVTDGILDYKYLCADCLELVRKGWRPYRKEANND